MSIDWSLYQKRLNLNGTSYRDKEINLMKDSITNDFKDNPSYRSAYINSSNTTTDIQVINNKNSYIKTIFMMPNDHINVGDIFEFDSLKWICMEVDKTNPVNETGVVYQAKHTITVNKNHVLYTIPCVVESSVRLYQLGIEENKYLAEPSTNIVVRVPNNETTQLIKRNDIYKIGMQNYKVVDVNDIIESGLLILKMEFALEDDINISHIYNIKILNGNLQISQSQSLILNVAVYEDGEILTSPPSYSFISSNETIATINNGVVTFLSVGNANITVTLDNNNKIQDIISIEVIADPINNKTVQIVGNTNIIKNYTEDYSCIFKNNGSKISEHSIFYLTADDSLSETLLAQIIVQDETLNTCTIKGLGLGYVRLFVKNSDNNIVSDSYRIKIENLF